ncbi:excalibur calcium-binding domain-containing protein [Rhodococcus yananensis]|uniref:excalibur calcium-binding domain-containing protein n=1 Tax=Rhodococcus yananensis TaxID=2879464 RepID=UPI001CF8DD12|nr:excalibur calcium-binding domain-containing protein [Rhodococcus yananensis]
MAEKMTPSEAKVVVERHLRSLGFVLDTGRSPGRMLVRAQGVVAKITLRADPVGRSELATFLTDRSAGAVDARAYYSLSGYRPTAVEYATDHRIQLFDFDTSGRVTGRNQVGLRAPDSARFPPLSLDKRVEAGPQWSSDPIGKVMAGWRSPVAVAVRALLTSAGTSTRAALFSTAEEAVEAQPVREPTTPENRRANWGFVALGGTMIAVVGAAVLLSAVGSDREAVDDPGQVESVTVTRTVTQHTETEPGIGEGDSTMLEIQSSSPRPLLTTTTSYTSPSPVTTPPPATTVPIQPAPAYTPEYIPPPAPQPEPSVYYANCTAARVAGAAPILRGSPGYRSELDRDDDGIACE